MKQVVHRREYLAIIGAGTYYHPVIKESLLDCFGYILFGKIHSLYGLAHSLKLFCKFKDSSLCITMNRRIRDEDSLPVRLVAAPLIISLHDKCYIILVHRSVERSYDCDIQPCRLL